MSNFKKAIMKGLLFPTIAGLHSANLYDLVNMPLTHPRGPSLDNTAKTINAALQASKVESFVEETSKECTDLALALEIVKEIIKDKKDALAKAEQAVENKKKKQQIMELIARKKDTELEGKSLEDLEGLLEAL